MVRDAFFICQCLCNARSRKLCGHSVGYMPVPYRSASAHKRTLYALCLRVICHAVGISLILRTGRDAYGMTDSPFEYGADASSAHVLERAATAGALWARPLLCNLRDRSSN